VKKGRNNVKKLFIAAALLLAGCGINPMEGDFGIVAVVPEKKTCWDKVRHDDGRVNYQARKCNAGGHDVEVFGRKVGR
jgi:hypothetical protein